MKEIYEKSETIGKTEGTSTKRENTFMNTDLKKY